MHIDSLENPRVLFAGSQETAGSDSDCELYSQTLAYYNFYSHFSVWNNSLYHAALPTYRIVGDNVDLRLHPRHQTLERRDQDHHWFNMYAIKDRVVGLHLADN